MSIDVVYKIGQKCSSTWPEYQELRYSIRSLSLFSDLGRVFIVGHKPDWLKNVVHIPVSDPYKRNKDANLINKMLLASFSDVSDQFLNMSDDQYFLKKTSIDQIIPIGISRPGKGNDPWNKRRKNTVKALQQAGKPHDYDFEGHCPYVLDKNLYPSAVLNYSYGEAPGMLGNTLYHNHYEIGPHKNIDHVGGAGLKATKQEIIETGNKFRFLNINHGLTDVHKGFLMGKFPEKSPYEIQ